MTSNEDIFHQISLNKTNNTHIIDLNNDKHVTSIGNGNNNNMICAICGDQAIGYNYSALSCASCKAFFLRNGNRNVEKLRCYSHQRPCSVAHEMPHKCQRCRLERCFAVGMRKDLILSDEAKQRRRERREKNRNITSSSSSISEPLSNSESATAASDEIDRLLMDINPGIESETLFGRLSVEDWITIQNIQASFKCYFQKPPAQFNESLDLPDRVSAIISWSQFSSQNASRFISFFRQINEFESLHADDRFILVKYNLLSIFPLWRCYYSKPTSDCCSIGSSEGAERGCQFLMLPGGPNNMREKFIKLINCLIKITEQDPAILSIVVTILIFSSDLIMSENKQLLKDQSTINQAQNHYTTVLWNYLVNKYSQLEACQRFVQLLRIIFRIQLETKTFREFFQYQYAISNTVDKIPPLMQAVLHIS